MDIDFKNVFSLVLYVTMLKIEKSIIESVLYLLLF